MNIKSTLLRRSILCCLSCGGKTRTDRTERISIGIKRRKVCPACGARHNTLEVRWAGERGKQIRTAMAVAEGVMAGLS